MKTIPIQVVEETDVSRQYDASFYTHGDGLYLWASDGGLVLVTGVQVLYVGVVSTWKSLISSPTQISIQESQGESISVDTLLKAIAITQQPELIKEI